MKWSNVQRGEDIREEQNWRQGDHCAHKPQSEREMRMPILRLRQRTGEEWTKKEVFRRQNQLGLNNWIWRVRRRRTQGHVKYRGNNVMVRTGVLVLPLTEKVNAGVTF